MSGGREVGDEIGHVEIRLIAERGKAAETEAGGGGLDTELDRQVPALGDQPDRTRRQVVGREVEGARVIENAEAVGAEQNGAGQRVRVDVIEGRKGLEAERITLV